jgi:hypothetical protein
LLHFRSCTAWLRRRSASSTHRRFDCQFVTQPVRRRKVLAYWAFSALLLAASLVVAQELPVRRGQTVAEVRQRLGPPARVSRQILFRRHIEQWHYDAPVSLQVEFNSVRGEEPYVCSILQLSPGSP